MKRLFLACAALVLLASSAWGQCSSGPGVNCTVNPVFTLPLDGIKYTYATGGQVVAANSATDVLEVCGSATRTIRVTKVSIGGRATSAITAPVQLIKKSSANTGGTATTETAAAYDTNAPAASAVVKLYTANPTYGAIVGLIASAQIFLGNLTTGQPVPQLVWYFGDRPAQAVILRGVAQCLALNLAGITYSGNLLDIDVEWTEE